MDYKEKTRSDLQNEKQAVKLVGGENYEGVLWQDICKILSSLPSETEIAKGQIQNYREDRMAVLTVHDYQILRVFENYLDQQESE